MLVFRSLILCIILSAALSFVTPVSLANSYALSDEQRKNATDLMQTALESELGYNIVESLTTEIGPRLAGSEAEKRARDWGVKLGNELGFDSVVVEEFTIPFWDRGELTIALEAPYRQELYGPKFSLMVSKHDS